MEGGNDLRLVKILLIGCCRITAHSYNVIFFITIKPVKHPIVKWTVLKYNPVQLSSFLCTSSFNFYWLILSQEILPLRTIDTYTAVQMFFSSLKKTTTEIHIFIQQGLIKCIKSNNNSNIFQIVIILSFVYSSNKPEKLHHSFHKNIKQYNCYFKMLQYFTILQCQCLTALLLK